MEVFLTAGFSIQFWRKPPPPPANILFGAQKKYEKKENDIHSRRETNLKLNSKINEKGAKIKITVECEEEKIYRFRRWRGKFGFWLDIVNRYKIKIKN